MTHASAPPEIFTPGSYWTPERARESLDAMNRALASPEMKAMLDGAAEEAGNAHAVAEMQTPRKATGAVDGSRVIMRRGRPSDVPRFTELIASADLPPLFIPEWIYGFAAAEYEGEVIACGGLEMYDGSGVIRSVVVDEPGRGLGLGRTIAELLIADAKAAGATDVYLVTVDAWPFWKHLGFQDVPFDDWAEPSRACWQYLYLTSHLDFFREMGGHSMWRAI
jgi:amino-acid N-acetyltransferase